MRIVSCIREGTNTDGRGQYHAVFVADGERHHVQFLLDDDVYASDPMSAAEDACNQALRLDDDE